MNTNALIPYIHCPHGDVAEWAIRQIESGMPPRDVARQLREDSRSQGVHRAAVSLSVAERIYIETGWHRG